VRNLTDATVLNPQRTHIRLATRLDFGTIEMVDTALLRIRGEETGIQIPRVARRRIDMASEVADGHSLLVAAPVMSSGGSLAATFVLLTPQIVEK